MRNAIRAMTERARSTAAKLGESMQRRWSQRSLLRHGPGESIGRLTLGAKLLLVLCSVAAFSTAMALVLQDRSLSTDLRGAARSRLERSARVAQQVVEDHLIELFKRYRAISGTPQFLANLETGDGPTLSHFAERLTTRHDADSIIFTNERGIPIAFTGDPFLMASTS